MSVVCVIIFITIRLFDLLMKMMIGSAGITSIYAVGAVCEEVLYRLPLAIVLSLTGSLYAALIATLPLTLLFVLSHDTWTINYANIAEAGVALSLLFLVLCHRERTRAAYLRAMIVCTIAHFSFNVLFALPLHR